MRKRKLQGRTKKSENKVGIAYARSDEEDLVVQGWTLQSGNELGMGEIR